MLRGGIFDGFNEDWADCLAFALGKLDERLGADTSKVNRPDYIKRTIEAVVANEAAKAEQSAHGAGVAAAVSEAAR